MIVVVQSDIEGQVEMFPDLVPIELPEPEQVEKLSADRKRTLRQRRDVERGIHPFTRYRVHEDPDRKCGNCYFRDVLPYHRRGYPKCLRADGVFVSHSAASDIRAWWPGCTEHVWGDPKLSVDAARSGPSRAGD